MAIGIIAVLAIFACVAYINTQNVVNAQNPISTNYNYGYNGGMRSGYNGYNGYNGYYDNAPYFRCGPFFYP